jgi:hypothetical protein
VVTPETKVWLAGYGTKRVPDGKLHDLWAKALALEDAQGRRAVLITSDFQGVPRSVSDRFFARLRAEFGLERRQVMLTFSHNHCGLRLGDDLVNYYPVEAGQVALVNGYTDLMVEKLVRLVGESLAPARLQAGEGRATFAVNRRNNREAEVPALIEQGRPLAGPVDHAVPVLTVTRPDGRLAAVLFGYACHPTTLNFNTRCTTTPASLSSRSRGLTRGRGAVREHLRGRPEPAAPPHRRALSGLRPEARLGGGGRAARAPEDDPSGAEDRLRVRRAAVPEGRHPRGAGGAGGRRQPDPRPVGRAHAAQTGRRRGVRPVVPPTRSTPGGWGATRSSSA